MSSSGSAPSDLWSLLTSSHPASTITRSVATAALAGGLTFYVTRPSNNNKSVGPSDKPDTAPAPPPKDQASTSKPRSKLRSGRATDTSASESGSDDEGKRVRFQGAQKPFSKPLPVAVFWDVDNCSPPSGSSGRHLVQCIRKHLSGIDTGTGPDKEELGQSGPILSFKAYLELSSAEGVGPAQVTLRSELQGSGVSLIDTPKSGRKDVADKMIIADMMAFALDVPPPARVVLISGDRDFAYPLSLIRGRGYQVILVTPPVGAVPILEASANHVARWRQDVLGLERDGFGRLYSTPSKPSYQRSSSPGPSGRKTPPPGGAGSQSMATSTSQQSASSASVPPYQQPKPKPDTTLTGPGAAPVPTVFQPLVQALEEFRKEGDPRPLRSRVALRLTAIDKDVYEKAGASSWGDYVAVAVAAGIVVVGSNHAKTGFEWIALRTVDSPLFQTKTTSTKAPATGNTSLATPTPKKLTAAALEGAKTPLVPTPRQQAASWDDGNEGDKDDDDDHDDAVSATDGIYTPPPAFEALIRSIIEAEKQTGQSPPFTDIVGEILHASVKSGKTPDPFGPLGVKSFGSYVTSAFKHRVARLTPSKEKGRAALLVMPAYQSYLDALRRGEAVEQYSNIQQQQTLSAPTPAGKAGHTSPQKKPGVLPNFLAKAGSSNGDTSSPQGTPTSKKSTAYDKPGMLLPHMPSGARIPAKYFPLANVLLFEREKGHQYSTDAYLFPIVSKHKHIGSQFKTSDAFAEYLNGAQRDEVVTLEPGFKPGTRHVRLAERLHDPREKEASRNGERLPPAGADPYTSSPPRQNAASSASASEVSSAGPVMTKEPVTIEEPSVEDRKRFKPLMDIMFALRKHEPPQITPRRTMVYELLTKKHCPDKVPIGERDGFMITWLREHGASSIGDYTRQGEKFGFVVLGRESRPDGVQGKKIVRLSEKYEARL